MKTRLAFAGRYDKYIHNSWQNREGRVTLQDLGLDGLKCYKGS
jgi:hypothetical protein